MYIFKKSSAPIAQPNHRLTTAAKKVLLNEPKCLGCSEVKHFFALLFSFSMPFLLIRKFKDSHNLKCVLNKYFTLLELLFLSFIFLLIPFFKSKIFASLLSKTYRLGLAFNYQDWTLRFGSLGSNPHRTGPTRPACYSESWTSCSDPLCGSPWCSEWPWHLALRVPGLGMQLLQTQWWELKETRLGKQEQVGKVTKSSTSHENTF